MILEDRKHAAAAHTGDRETLIDLFSRAVLRHPGAVALADPPNRESFTDGEQRSLTFAQADRVITAIAGRLRRLGLQTDAVIAHQLPNTVESVLVLLGILRAGMIAAPLPMLWRRSELAAALARCGAKALLTTSRIGTADHCEIAMHAAAETFPVRYVCAFGRDLPDGVIPLDDLFDADATEAHATDPLAAKAPAPFTRAGNPAAHTAIVTFDVMADGIAPVARSHAELIAGGLSAFVEGGNDSDAVRLSAVPISSFAGVALALVPWLLDAGTLVLHQPFDPAVFAAQRKRHQCGTIVVPGPMLERMSQAGLIAAGDGLQTIVALWRAPERLANAPAWGGTAEVLDVLAFGEVGLLTAPRGPSGKPADIPFGVNGAARGASGAVLVAEIARTDAGTVALRGPTVPRAAFPPGAERGNMPCLRAGAGGFVDTGFTCRSRRDGDSVQVTSAPPGVVSVGGYRLVLREIGELAAKTDAIIAALPDALSGHRLAGYASDRNGARKKLDALGVNPLIVAALRARDPAPTA